MPMASCPRVASSTTWSVISSSALVRLRARASASGCGSANSGFRSSSRSNATRMAATAARSFSVAGRTATRDRRGAATAGPGARRCDSSGTQSAAEVILVGTAAPFRVSPTILTGIGAGDLAPCDQRLEHEFAGGDGRRVIALPRQPDVVHDIDQPRHGLEGLVHRRGVHVIGDLQRAAFVEPHHRFVGVRAARAYAEGCLRGPADQLARDRRRTDQLSLVFELDLARYRRKRGVEVGQPWYRLVFA